MKNVFISPLIKNEAKSETDWFILYVAPHRELSVCEYADRFDLITYFPRLKKMIKPPKKRKPIFVETRYPVFPGYVFVSFHPDWSKLLKAEFAIRYLGRPEVPFRISSFDIEQLQNVEEAGFITRNRGIVIGDSVVVPQFGDITLPVESIGKDSYYLTAGTFRIKIPLVPTG